MAWEMTLINAVNPDKGDVQLKPVSAIQVRDEPWHTWTLPLGWPVGGVHDALDDDATITSVCSTVLSAEQTARKLLAVGDSSGELSLLQFPCVSGRARGRRPVPHTCARHATCRTRYAERKTEVPSRAAAQKILCAHARTEHQQLLC